MDRIRSSDLTELRDEWLKDRAPATVVRRMAFLSHVYTVIRKDWGFDQLANPVQLVRRPAIDDARDRRLFDRTALRGLSEEQCPRQELDWIIQATRSSELPTILTVARETGMRRSEVVGIQREHLDLMHGVVHLPHTKNGRARRAADPASARGATPLGHRQADARAHLRDASGLRHARLHPRATPRPPALRSPVPSPRTASQHGLLPRSALS
ncbi:hypothetical protein WJ968_37170 [Achromobacter xylosoxidans]